MRPQVGTQSYLNSRLLLWKLCQALLCGQAFPQAHWVSSPRKSCLLCSWKSPCSRFFPGFPHICGGVVTMGCVRKPLGGFLYHPKINFQAQRQDWTQVHKSRHYLLDKLMCPSWTRGRENKATSASKPTLGNSSTHRQLWLANKSNQSLSMYCIPLIHNFYRWKEKRN